MVFPPGQGQFGSELMEMWRRYLEEYAEHEGDIERQIIVGAYHAAEVLGSLAVTLDRGGKYRTLIEQRIELFHAGVRRAQVFENSLLTATLTLYNHLNTLSHELADGNSQAEALIGQVDEQVHRLIETSSPIERCAAATRAAFPLLSLMSLVVDQDGAFTSMIQKVERRFSAGDSQSETEWDGLLNALYRLVEMMQVFVTASDPDLSDQAEQIASRFQEEDQTHDFQVKLRNGFCRLFELAHLVTIHLDATLAAE